MPKGFFYLCKISEICVFLVQLLLKYARSEYTSVKNSEKYSFLSMIVGLSVISDNYACWLYACFPENMRFCIFVLYKRKPK